MELLRSFVTVLAAPLSLMVAIAVAGVLLRVLGQRRSGTAVVMTALVAGWLGSTTLMAQWLIAPLENKFPPLGTTHCSPARRIVVLGSGYAPRAGIPVTGALDEDGLVRITEALRLMSMLGCTQLVVSGGAPAGRSAPAEGYALLARELGVADSAIVKLATPRDTAAEAQALLQLGDANPFYLVTSAYHMPRAMRLMTRAGLHPIAAPTGQRSGASPGGWRAWVPGSAGLRISERALHEYAALAAIDLGAL